MLFVYFIYGHQTGHLWDNNRKQNRYVEKLLTLLVGTLQTQMCCFKALQRLLLVVTYYTLSKVLIFNTCGI